MKQSKFGALDIILAILVVAGIGLNVYAYGFLGSDSDEPPLANPTASITVPGEPPPSTASAPSADATGPAGSTETPTPTKAPTSVPQDSVVNTLKFKIDSLNVTVNGYDAAIDELGSAPYILDGTSMLPLRAVYDLLGGSIEYDSETRYITAAFEGTSLKAKTGETGAEINGVFTALPVAPVNKNGTAYVPARTIKDALGAELTWDGATQTLTLEIPSRSPIDTSILLPVVSQPTADTAPPAPESASPLPPGSPTAGDFAWFTSGARITGIPEGATRVADLLDVFGDWKMFIWIDPDHVAEDESAYILATANIIEIGGTVLMNVHEFVIVDEDGSASDLSGFGEVTYSGEYLSNDRGFFAGEEGYQFTITDFYTKDGRQYGIGMLDVQSGEPCYVALTRP